jgi:hypothetical protein
VEVEVLVEVEVRVQVEAQALRQGFFHQRLGPND